MKLRLTFFATSSIALACASAHAQPYPPPQQQQQPAPQAPPGQFQPAPYAPPPYQPPPQQQPYPPQPQQPYPPQQQQPYPPQQQPYQPPPQQYQPLPPPQPPPPQNYPQPYPQQQYQPLPPPQPPGPYQQQPYPPQQQYPQQQPYPPQQQYQPQPQQPYVPSQPHPPTPGLQPRGNGEMFFLYGTSIAYGVGTGIWIDGLAGTSDPGIAIIAPIGLGVAMPIGVYFLDQNVPLHYGTPAAMSAGMVLGALEGVAIGGVQFQNTGDKDHWSFGGYATATFIGATVGGFGGYAFGEWAHMDPRNMAFIGSGAAWGSISGTFLGAGFGATPSNGHYDWKDGGSIGGLVGYNAGIVSAGALALAWTPSWYSQKWMWLGFLAGTAGASIVYPFYALDPHGGEDVHHGLIANGLGGLAGVALAGALTAGSHDDGSKSVINELPFQLSVATTQGGATVQAFGVW